MQTEKIAPIVKGMLKQFPGVRSLLKRRTGGTDESRYCYAVWMRHLKRLARVVRVVPENVAELGPGDSLGIGLSALLSGCSRLIALDVVQYWDHRQNLRIFDELVELFRSRSRVPGFSEYPRLFPAGEDCGFPDDIIPEIRLRESLSETRIAGIKRELMDINNPGNAYIKVCIPWDEAHVLEKESLDLIISQAVLEHVDDLQGTFRAMHQWLKPSGVMSHTIDFKSHGITASWNGHWLFNDREWKIVRGGERYLINRHPYSTYLRLLSDNHFVILETLYSKMHNSFLPDQFADRFKKMSAEEMSIAGMYVMARKT